MNAPDVTPFDAWLESTLVGHSVVMRQLRQTIVRAARSELPVLISGATGTGKELVAEALHRISGRQGALVAVNVCALGESMFESALFGHVRGAFTGSVGDSAGLVAEADRGTLFLDEIGVLPIREQVKLLRVLETRTYRPVGAPRDRVSNFRLVTATNEDLDEAVSAGRFRDDLRHRLGRLVLRVPPLAARRDDIPMLATHFVNVLSDRAPMSIQPDAMTLLASANWAGNVRELRSVVAAAVTLSDGRQLRRSDVAAILGETSRDGAAHRAPATGEARNALEEILEECGYDTALASARLGVHRATIYRRMRALGLAVPAGMRQREAADGPVRIRANVRGRDANSHAQHRRPSSQVSSVQRVTECGAEASSLP